MRYENDGPLEDPFDHACEEAARKLVSKEPMLREDWDVLGARASAELREFDFTDTF